MARARRTRPVSSSSAALAVIILLAGLGIVGCSSAPKTPEGIHDTKDQAAEYAQYGNRYYREGNYDQALNFFDLAFRENASVDNLPGIAQSYNSIGKVYLATGQVDTAEANFQRAYEIAVEIDDAGLLLQSATHLGEVSMRRGDLELADAFFTEALDQRSGDSDLAALAVLYHNLGTLASRNADYDSARQYLEDAIAINEENGYLSELAANHYMLASTLSRQGLLDEANSEALAALDLDKKMEDSVGIAADLKALGLIALKQDDPETAYDFMKRALRVTASIGLVGETKSVLEHLASIADTLELPDEAEAYRAQRASLDAGGS